MGGPVNHMKLPDLQRALAAAEDVLVLDRKLISGSGITAETRGLVKRPCKEFASDGGMVPSVNSKWKIMSLPNCSFRSSTRGLRRRVGRGSTFHDERPGLSKWLPSVPARRCFQR